MAIFFLYAHKTIYHLIQSRRQMPKIFMKSIANSEGRKYCVVDQSRTKVCKSTRRVLTRIFIQMACNKIVCKKR